MKELKVKTDMIISIFTKINDYHNSYSIKHKTMDFIQSLLVKFDNTISKIKKNHIQDNDITNYFHVYHLLEYSTSLVSQIASSITLFDIELIQTHDATKYADVLKNHLKIKNESEKLKKISPIIDANILKEIDYVIFKKSKWGEHTKETFDNITKLTIMYPYSIKLFAYLTHIILQTCILHETCDYILTQVDAVKKSIMVNDTKLGPINLYNKNPHMKTFGLTPYTKLMTMPHLTKYLFGNSMTPDAISKKEKLCVILITRIITKPIQFDLNNLINQYYIKKYEQPDEYGINETMIEKFKNMSFVNDKRAKWNFSIKIIGSEYDNCIVFEQLSATMYRSLNKFVYDHEILGGGSRKIIKKDKLINLINYANDKCRIHNETVVSSYNAIQEEKIIKNMFLPIKFDVSQISLASKIVQSDFVRNEINIKLKKQVFKLFTKLNSKGKIKNNRDIAGIIHDESLSNILYSVLIEQYDLYMFKNKEKTQFPLSETLKSFLSELEHINGDFKRRSHDIYITKKIDQKIYADSESNKQRTLLAFIYDIIELTTLKIITNNRNIYQQLLYKNKLLSLSII